MRGFNDDRRSTATVTVRPTVVGFESVVELPPDNLREASDVRDLLGRLPEGAATIFAWGIHRDDPHAIAPRWIATLHIEELGRPPPTLGVDLLPAVVLAWYPRRGGSILGGVLGRGSPLLWQEWLFLAPDDPETRRLLESHGVRFGAAGEIVHASAISAGHDDGVLVLSSKRELAQAALGRKATAPNDGRKVFMVLRADAKKAAEALERVAEGLGDELHLMGPARWYSKLLGAAERVEMVGVQEDPTGPGVIRARVDALLHEEEATAEDVKKLLEPDFPARDLRLPRRLRDEEHELKLTLVANVDSSAEVVERLQGRSSRLKVTALDPKSVRIQNLPAEKPDESVAVSELGGAEKRKTLKTEELPQALATRLDEVVSSAEREHSSTVDRALSMLRWVNGAMTYRTRRRSVPLEEVVAELHGDCTEYAALAVELLRRAGIPAKTKSGYVVTELGFGGHAWVAFHDGRGWREADPTGPSLRVGSGHFAFPLVGVSLVLDPRRFQIVEVRSEPR